jgi:membrane-associated phospholipid phosphatase
MASRPWRRSARLHQTNRSAAAGPLARQMLPTRAKTRLVFAVGALALTTILVAVAWVSAPASATIYRAAVPHTAGLPGGVDHLADAAIVALATGYAVIMWHSRRALMSLALGLSAGAGAVAAYLASESVKLLFREERPCRVAISLDGCPAVGDWSFPSNHMTIAGGLALAMLMVSPRSIRLSAALVAAVAVGRVGQGAHYPHDVLAGLGVGVGCVAAIVLVTAPATEGLLLRIAGGRRPPGVHRQPRDGDDSPP